MSILLDAEMQIIIQVILFLPSFHGQFKVGIRWLDNFGLWVTVIMRCIGFVGIIY